MAWIPSAKYNAILDERDEAIHILRDLLAFVSAIPGASSWSPRLDAQTRLSRLLEKVEGKK